MITLMHGYDYDMHDYVYSYMCVCGYLPGYAKCRKTVEQFQQEMVK